MRNRMRVTRRPQATDVTSRLNTAGLTPDRNEALITAEIDRLGREMLRSRVISKRRLHDRVHAEYWGPPGFDAALNGAIERGLIEQLPLGYVRLPRQTPASKSNSTA